MTLREQATVAAMAAALGVGDAYRLNIEQRAAWRMRGLEWMRAELDVLNNRLKGATPALAADVFKLYRPNQWPAGLRDAGYFDRRPPSERDAFRQAWAAAARLSSQAFAIDPKLADDMEAHPRYNAACTAALAGSGPGEDADTLGIEERAGLRSQALAWLRADLAHWSRLAASTADSDRQLALKVLRNWQADADLAGLRNNQGLAILPAEEAEACRKLWDDVRNILNAKR
jgi:hypothetical protein